MRAAIQCADWQEGNARYLAASLHWLRVRLEIQSQDNANASQSADDSEVQAAAQEREESESAMQHPPALAVLQERLGLSPFEADLLLLCAAMEFDTRIAGLCALAQGNSNCAYPSFALAMSLFDGPAWDALSPERPLRYWKLIEVHPQPGQPLVTSLLRADERIVSYLKGLNFLDERLACCLVRQTPVCAAPAISVSQRQVANRVISAWNSPNEARPMIVQLLGGDSMSKRAIASCAAAYFGLRLQILPAQFLPAQLAEVEALARLWERESTLLPLALYLDAQETELQPGHTAHSLVRRFLSHAGGPLFLAVRELWPDFEGSMALEAAKPNFTEQQEGWEEAIGTKSADDSVRLASRFHFNLGTIRDVAQMAEARTGENAERSLFKTICEVCRETVRPRLDALAQRVETKATWDDLVLPAEQIDLLHRITAQVGYRAVVHENWGFARKMNRGLGVSVLFAGESGTGKTTAAEVMANELELNLYRIDLSAVVSKYIGETEKNLRRLFDAAEDGGSILLFDEADALFGKRSEVKDSHDRYANIEINYLLQRLECFSGLAILATNMKSALDSAFLRRLRFVVQFAFPGAVERRRMWQKAFPHQTPTADLDYERLARLNLTGGTIHNAALNAAFLAAEAGTPVTMSLVLAAARTELLKLDRPVNEADFRWLASEGTAVA